MVNNINTNHRHDYFNQHCTEIATLCDVPQMNDFIDIEKNATDSTAKLDRYEDDGDNYKRMLEDMKRQIDASKENAKKEAAAMKKKVLGGLIGRVEIMQGHLYSSRSWSNLMKIYGSAKSVHMSENADLADIEKAIRDLSGGLSTLREAELDDTQQRERLPLVIKPGGTVYEQAGMAVAAGNVAQSAGIAFNSQAGTVSVNIDIRA